MNGRTSTEHKSNEIYISKTDTNERSSLLGFGDWVDEVEEDDAHSGWDGLDCTGLDERRWWMASNLMYSW